MATPAATVPLPIAPGPEMAALRRFHRDTTWTGTIRAGGMGQGSPAMTARGRGSHHDIQDGRWIVGDYVQDQELVDGTPVLTWQLHWVAGWDPAAGEYRATIADCYGHADVLHGHIDGDRMEFTSIGAPPVRIRLTWELVDDEVLRWRNEVGVGDGPWALVEEYVCRSRLSPETDHARPIGPSDARANRES
ncbi:MAG TPA: DUF1579 family protein [Pseudonocardia sp.]|nr:DUF1579 family protein [Pseudonocardia sp.]